MTSRPALGVQQRQAQRSLSGSGLSQRPPHQRTLSQQHLPQSPIRKEPSSLLDFSPADPPDASSQGRYSTPRRVGSRLRLELSHDSAEKPDPTSAAAFTESPNPLDRLKSLTPSHLLPPTDSPDVPDSAPSFPSVTRFLEAESARLPMPTRRLRYGDSFAQRGSPTTNQTSTKKDSRPKPYSIEIPSDAPRYGSQAGGADRPTMASSSSSSTGPGPGPAGPVASGSIASSAASHADFYPWTGNHPEDKFSETVIRQGYFDKVPATQTETSSAKGTLFTSIKHKSGLHALSTVFTGILGQRRHSGRITTPSTFKPPPRVTLTDTKRELWLKDLANPAISLRRLSRTIPHGIRGKVLLDHCLNKNVPIDRAVWLAKCVGANEIRAFKRKGVNGTFAMGGEVKWIKDWTAFVEQFVEAVFSAFGEAEWKSKVNYAVRLATHLYAEYLLDRDHYVEWLLSGLENSPQAKLPIWILVTQIYWKDLLKLRKSGRRLVTVLLSHLHLVQTHPDKDVLVTLSTRLTSLLSSLMTLTPENFVSPNAWLKYRETLLASLPPDDEHIRAVFKVITQRNEQLIPSGNRSRPAARHILVKMLDTTLRSFMPDELPGQCWQIARDKPALARTLLEWCVSVYRPGISKIYVTQRVLLSWSALGLNVAACVLDFLDSSDLDELGRRTTFYHLACELARSGLLPVPTYIQWLMARGGITKECDVLPGAPCATRLLIELPTHILTKSQWNIRTSMLQRVSYNVQDEASDAETALKCLQRALGMPLDPGDPILLRNPLSINKLCKRIALSSRSLKAGVGSWLRATLVADLDRASKDGSSHRLETSSSTFNAVRAVFESAGDFSMLADLLKSVVTGGVSSVEILASCADTLSLHLPVFSALGVGKDLFDLLYAKLRMITEEQGLAARPLLASLANLAPRLPKVEPLAAQLKRELTQSDRNHPVDACSPVSDNMGTRLQGGDADFLEEVEKHLSGGTTLDRNTMDRFFQLLVARLQTSWDKSLENQRAYAVLLARLRAFDPPHFDAFMAKWLHHIRAVPNRPPVAQIFPVLISVGCLSIPLVLASAYYSDPSTTAGAATGAARPPASGAPPSAQALQATSRTGYAQEALELAMMPVSPDRSVSAEECYRIAVLQDQAQRENPQEFLGVIRHALAEYNMCREGGQTTHLQPLDKPAIRDRVTTVLRSIALKDLSAVCRVLAVKSADPFVGEWIDYLTTRLLMPTADAANLGTQVTFDQVLKLTNEFTLPFCQLKLSLSLVSGDQNGGNPEGTDRMQSHLELFAKVMDNAIEANNITWTGMLPSLSPEITHHLKSMAQARFLELLPSMKGPTTPPSQERTLEQSLQMAENFLSVIDSIIRGAPAGRSSQLPTGLVDKLADLWDILSSSQDAAARNAVINHWLPSVLTFMTLHTPAFDASKTGTEAHARALITLCGIQQELNLIQTDDHLDPAPTKALADRTFDLALVLADNLADEGRAQCIRFLRDATSDPRLRYILSFAAAPTEHLMLSHRDRQQPAAAAAAGRAAGAIPYGGLLGTPASLWGQTMMQVPEKLSVFHLRRWEILNEPTPVIGENDTALSLALFEARKV